MRNEKYKIGNKVALTERATRRKMLEDCARRFGPEGVRQLKLMFKKWDDAIAKCNNESEIKHMRQLAAMEIFSVLNYRGGLTVNDQVVIPAEEEYKPKKIDDA